MCCVATLHVCLSCFLHGLAKGLTNKGTLNVANSVVGEELQPRLGDILRLANS